MSLIIFGICSAALIAIGSVLAWLVDELETFGELLVVIGAMGLLGAFGAWFIVACKGVGL